MNSVMRALFCLGLLALLGSCDNADSANGITGQTKKSGGPEIHDVDMLEFGNFEFIERMELPERIRKWNGKRIRAVGFMNPGRQIRDVKEFELVMNRDSCCYGTRPRMNHFFQVLLKDSPTVYSSDPVTVEGRFEIDEQWDGDWLLGLYWLKDARIVK